MVAFSSLKLVYSSQDLKNSALHVVDMSLRPLHFLLWFICHGNGHLSYTHFPPYPHGVIYMLLSPTISCKLVIRFRELIRFRYNFFF